MNKTASAIVLFLCTELVFLFPCPADGNIVPSCRHQARCISSGEHGRGLQVQAALLEARKPFATS